MENVVIRNEGDVGFGGENMHHLENVEKMENTEKVENAEKVKNTENVGSTVCSRARYVDLPVVVEKV